MASEVPSIGDIKVRYVVQERVADRPEAHWHFSNSFIGDDAIDHARAWTKEASDEILSIETRIVMETTVVIKAEVV